MCFKTIFKRLKRFKRIKILLYVFKATLFSSPNYTFFRSESVLARKKVTEIRIFELLFWTPVYI